MTESLERAAVAAAYAQRWDDALALLQRAAEAGDQLAQGQLAALAGRHPRDLLAPPKPELISDRAWVYVCKGFAPTGFGEWLIARAASGLERALVNTRAGRGQLDPMRTALYCQFNADRRDVITAVMQYRAMPLVRVPLSGHEPPNVISYEPGQKFDYHTDFVDPDEPSFADELRSLGQRVATIVTYLNGDFVGAPTDFPMLGIAFRGDPGDAVAFSNVHADGSPDRNTVHAGLPPKSGRKWVLSQWFRSKPIPAH